MYYVYIYIHIHIHIMPHLIGVVPWGLRHAFAGTPRRFQNLLGDEMDAPRKEAGSCGHPPIIWVAAKELNKQVTLVQIHYDLVVCIRIMVVGVRFSKQSANCGPCGVK